MPSTLQLVSTLVENDQDFEWYPTTDAMITVIRRWLPENATSILDVGAGDGRVLTKLAEKCKNATLYSIELSSILVQAQPKEIVPLGTNLYEQNLSCLPTDYIFSNPPYSQYEEWVCKIVSEGFAKKAFLVIPQRWKDSKLIQKSLKQRGATIRVVYSDDFHNAERQARAVVDIVEISYPIENDYYNKPKDPFDIWFDQNIDTFDHAEEFKESETSRELARRYAHASIDEMVEAYREEYARLERNYRAIFQLDYAILEELGINKDAVREGLKKKMAGLKTKYWEILFERLDAITSRLTTASKKKLLEKLTQNTSVEFTATNAYSVVLWAIKNANQYFDEQLIELFQELSCFDNVLNYKSNTKTWVKDGWRYGNREWKNTHYSLDYRIVVEKWVAIQDKKRNPYSSYEYPGNLNRNCHELIADVVAVMSNLGFSTYSSSSLDREWKGGQWENFYETNSDEILFQAKAYMNGNVHFRFMPDAIKALNINAGRLLKWVRTEEEVVTEMGYTPTEAKKYFHRNVQITASNVPLLGEGTPEPEPEEDWHPSSYDDESETITQVPMF
jgi:hypothetical protein